MELNPVIEENAGQNAAGFEEPTPDNSSLGRILNPIRFGVDNQDDDFDIPSYDGSANDMESIGSFDHIGSKVNTKGRRPDG